MPSKDVVDYAELMVQDIVKNMAKAGILNPADQVSVLKKQAEIYSMASSIIEAMINREPNNNRTMH